MMKRKAAMVCVVLLLLPLAFGLIQPVKASSNTWSVNWHDHIDYDYSPINVSSTIEVSGADGHVTDIVELVVTIAEYDYDPFAEMDFVYFKVVVYVKAIADPGYQPQYATKVSILLQKIYDDQDHTIIHMVHDELPPVYSQGYGLEQETWIESDPADRIGWALIPLEYAVGLAYEPLGVAMMLINMGLAFSSIPGVDFESADYPDTFAYSWWDNPGYHWTESPVRQYCFNVFRWKQDPVSPSGEYGLKIQAYVETQNPAVIPPILTPPIYLVIHRFSGGGCPYVSTWNGTHYVLDNNLIPAAEHSNGTDVVDYYKLQQPLIQDEGKYSLLISEVDKHSYLDRVQLLAVDHDPAFNIAVTPHGEILTYRNSAPPQTAITNDDYDVTNLVEKIDYLYYEGWPNDYLTVDFGQLDITQGAKLLVRADPPPHKMSIHVQVLKLDGWTDVATFIPRTYWSTDIVDLSAHLPDVNGELKVRLYLTGGHKIDYVGLDTTGQEEFEVRDANLAKVTHSTQGDVKETLMNSDDQYAELLPGEQITLEFTVPQNTQEKRDFIIILEGHYYTIQT